MDKDEIKKLFRELSDIKHYLEMFNEERNILEDLRAGQKELIEFWKLHRDHVDTKIEDVKATVKEGQFEIEDKMVEKVDEVKTDIVKGIANELTEESNPIKKVFKK